MTADEIARRIAARILGVERELSVKAELRQGIVASYSAGPPRTVNVTYEGGTIPAVPLLAHHAAPGAGDSVWIARTGTGGWLYHGKQG